MTHASRFRTPEGAARYVAAYDAVLNLWPVRHEAIDINSSYGITHINAAGAPDAPPLVLLHGAQMSSPVWYANVAPLSQHFRLYALDIIDQMGRSVPIKKLTTPDDCAVWLGEVLDALGLDRVTLVGHSQGGYLALNMTIRAPGRVARLILLSPSGSLGRVRVQTFMRMMPVFIRPGKSSFYRYLQWMTSMTLGEYHPVAEQFMIGAQMFKPGELSFGVVSRFTDDALRQIAVPTLVLVGDRDGTCEPQRDIARARWLIQNVEAVLVAGGGHLLPIDQADTTNAHLLRFLGVRAGEASQ